MNRESKSWRSTSFRIEYLEDGTLLNRNIMNDTQVGLETRNQLGNRVGRNPNRDLNLFKFASSGFEYAEISSCCYSSSWAPSHFLT